MTRQETKFAQSTEFSRWLRALPRPLDSSYIDNNNLDYVWFNYRQGWYITIEEKRYGANPSKSQIDSLGVVSQMLTLSSGSIVSTLRGNRAIEYRGHYFVVFENTSPDDSRWIRINGKTYSENGKGSILRLLQSGKL